MLCPFVSFTSSFWACIEPCHFCIYFHYLFFSISLLNEKHLIVILHYVKPPLHSGDELKITKQLCICLGNHNNCCWLVTMGSRGYLFGNETSSIHSLHGKNNLFWGPRVKKSHSGQSPTSLH